MHYAFIIAFISTLVKRLPKGKDREAVDPVTMKKWRVKTQFLGPSKTESIKDSGSEWENERKRQKHTRAELTLLAQETAWYNETYVMNYNHMASEMYFLDPDQQQFSF